MPSSRIEAIKQAIHDFEENYPNFIDPNYQPIPEEAEEHKKYVALKGGLDQAYPATAFRQFLDKANEDRAVTDRILAQTGQVGPVPEDLQVPTVTTAQPLAACGPVTYASGPAAQETSPKGLKPSSSREKPKRVRRRTKREPTTRADLTKSTRRSPTRRLKATIENSAAARRMEAYLASKGIGQTQFANEVGTTDRTLRSFRKTGKVRRDIFENIAKAMGTTKETLLKTE